MASPQPPYQGQRAPYGMPSAPNNQQAPQQHQGGGVPVPGRPPMQGGQSFQGRPAPPGSQFSRPGGPSPLGMQQQQVRPGMPMSGPSQQNMRSGVMQAPMQHQQAQQQPRPPMGVAPSNQNGMFQARPGLSPAGISAGMSAGGMIDSSFTNQMGAMSVGADQSQPPETSATSVANRSKRSARAYHHDDAPPAMDPTNGAWNGSSQQMGSGQVPMNQSNQPAWQQAAAARVAQYDQLEGNNDAALDQIPGQRNVLSAEHAAQNHAQMQAEFRNAVGFSQNIPIQPGAPGPQTPGINQPPHSAGQRFPGPRNKIDPDQIPSPVEAMDNDQDFFDKEWFETCGRGGLPLSTTDFAAIDQGNCSPKHMRLTTYSMPYSEELAATSHLPLAVVIQPFAQQRLEEAPIPIVECGPSGPPRCKRCRAYINPWAIFIEGGQKWACNLCGTATEVAADYFCNLDMSGRRIDFDQRFELSRGTIEFKVPKEYWAVQSAPPASLLLPATPANTMTETAQLSPKADEKNNGQFEGSTMGLSGQGGQAAKMATKVASEALGNFSVGQGRTVVRAPRPLTYLFAIDVSFSSVRSGSLKAALDSIREALYGTKERQDEIDTEDKGQEGDSGTMGPGYGLPHGSRVAIVTFDRSLHFYNLLPHLDHAQMLVVADIDEPFVPLSEGLLADPWESRTVIESLLENLPTIFAENLVAEAALGAAIRGAQAALSTIGGQCNVFLSTIPTVGPGSLKHREDTKLYGTDKEKQLFTPQDGFYRGVAEECVDAGIGINVFFFPSQYIDVATIGTLTGLTGGELFFHPRFDIVRDRLRLDSQIKRTILRESGYNATMRVRCSNGLHVTDHFGNFFMRNTTDLELASIDADKAIVAAFKHEGKLDEKTEAHFQSAILYTSADGERRVRCSNIAVPITSLLGNVFRYADLDSTMTYLTKSSVTLAQTKTLQDVRHMLTERCVKILLAYRRNCASSTSPGQLILPESFKLLPLYVLGINKSKAIKGGNVTSDVRTYFMRFLRGVGCGAIMSLLYPRMIALHNLQEKDGEPIEHGHPQFLTKRIKSPPLLRPSYLRMESHGVYLVENGEYCLLWIGSNVNGKLLEDLYGVSSLDELDPRMTALPKLPTKLSSQVRNLVNDFARQRNKPTLSVLIARQNRDGTEVELANSLLEDQNNDAMSYVDYLCHVHRIITTEMSGGGGGGNTKSDDNSEHSSLWRGW
ncbi:hypothetical protein CBS101457_004107 [Exobasidium rhododendri]|nr:hypothetical protein CBS101457_004107 [Exobasidium rhododendri]